MRVSRVINPAFSKRLGLVVPGLLFADIANASASVSAHTLDLTTHSVGYISLIVFVIAYLFVTAEEFTQLRKSKPVILAAGIIWAMVAYVSTQHGMGHEAEQAARHNLLE
ncbi:MAG: sodium:proton antiporter, partial [Gammaproteobacteria bacterium]